MEGDCQGWSRPHSLAELAESAEQGTERAGPQVRQRAVRSEVTAATGPMAAGAEAVLAEDARPRSHSLVGMAELEAQSEEALEGVLPIMPPKLPLLAQSAQQ